MPAHRSKPPVVDSRTFLEEVLGPAVPPPPRFLPVTKPRRQHQTARKSTGGKPPRVQVLDEGASTSATKSTSGSPGPSRRKSQYARKSTGGKHPKRMPNSDDSDLSSDFRIPHVPLHARHGSTSMSTSGDSAEIPLLLAQPDSVPAGPTASCGLCPQPLEMGFCAPDPSQPIQSLRTNCRHDFHYSCYMRYLTLAAPHMRSCCPLCETNILSDEKYLLYVTTIAGDECFTNLTEDVERLFEAVRIARQQVFMDMLGARQLHIVESELLTGPAKVDVNYRSPGGGFTALHLCAINNDVEAIDLLLRYGADKQVSSDKALMAIDYAKLHNSFEAAKRLE